MDPCLVYDIQVEDYINILCGLNYTRKQISVITRRIDFACEQATLDVNLPSFIVILNNTNTTSYTFKRVLTKVVDSNCVYRAVVTAPSGMKVDVKPATISFLNKSSSTKFSSTVDIDLGLRPQSDYIDNYGYLGWHEENGKHIVTSPIVSAFAP
ncbi:unnamed protein product [Ilex paraguariensis]|uniref:Subtilisin-like protease fibronectin type-III domain-containing protein n=1 Tax=Ilex paraguariensis TaxID=185542 RepID=A0ABC8UJJ9_9AQUA